MTRSIILRAIALCGVIVVNGVLFASRTADAQTTNWGQCEFFGDHCHCVAPVTETNCSSDGSCNWGLCKSDQT